MVNRIFELSYDIYLFFTVVDAANISKETKYDLPFAPLFLLCYTRTYTLYLESFKFSNENNSMLSNCF